MTVLVIVVTYNGLQLIDKCLQSVAQGASCFQTIVIDNGSEDGTPEHIRHNFPHVRIVETGTNHGFGKANNIGMKIAINENVDYIFLLNQDAWVEETTISNLVAASQRNPDFGILSPVHMNGSGNALDYGFLNYIARARCKDFISGCLLPRESPIQDVFEVPFINAALWLIPRRTVETVGGFNPFFFHYGEDRDYANRCRHFGLKIGFVPSEKGYHGRPQNDSTRKRKHQERRDRATEVCDSIIA